MLSPERPAFFGSQYPDSLLGAGEDVRGKRSGEDEAAAARPHHIDHGVSSGDVSAHVTIRFAERTGKDIQLGERGNDGCMIRMCLCTKVSLILMSP